ncbi:biotin/lipoyl-containing protein [Anaerovoracaceae bacterium 41-7]
MEEREIYNLIERFETSSLTVLEVEADGFHLRMEKSGQPQQLQQIDKDLRVPAMQSLQPAQKEPQSSNFREVKSPIVGIYYAAPEPGKPPFVTVGQQVKQGQVLCVVEAMKMMNELKSPVDGIIRSAGGVNGELVEFDQVLFEVEPC